MLDSGGGAGSALHRLGEAPAADEARPAPSCAWSPAAAGVSAAVDSLFADSPAIRGPPAGKRHRLTLQSPGAAALDALLPDSSVGRSGGGGPPPSAFTMASLPAGAADGDSWLQRKRRSGGGGGACAGSSQLPLGLKPELPGLPHFLARPSPAKRQQLWREQDDDGEWGWGGRISGGGGVGDAALSLRRSSTSSSGGLGLSFC